MPTSPRLRPLDHTALVVEDLDDALVRLTARGIPAQPAEEFPAEGTREAYVGAADTASRLLLIQPISTKSPYQRALDRRGPGLHHIAVVVADVQRALETATGWTVHPHSAESVRDCRTGWLSADGLGTLVEVIEGSRKSGTTAQRLVTRVEVPVTNADARVLAVPINGERLDGVYASPDLSAWITLGGQRIDAGELSA